MNVDANDEALTLIVRNSVLVQRADSAMRWLQHVALSSAAAQRFNSARGGWMRQPLAQRHRSVGLTLLVAVAVYVTAVLVTGEPRGWLWTIIPAVTAAVGVLLWVFSAALRSIE